MRGSAFQPGWKLTVFVAIFLPLTISLGVWQVGRGAQKRAMHDAYLRSFAGLPLRPHSAADRDRATQPFTRLRLTGQLGEEVFLVDNQVHDGTTGYWVIQTLFDQSGLRFLVNRGFLAAPKRREALPAVPQPPGTVSVIGVVWPFTGLVPLLQDDPWADAWPKRVQRLHIAEMAAASEALPVEVRLEESALAPHPAPFGGVLSDARHNGYAVTWFGLAITLVVLYGVAGRRGARQAQEETA